MTERHFLLDQSSLKKGSFCGRDYYFSEGGLFERPFKISPTKGVHDFNTCEGCKGNLAQITAKIAAKLNKFPDCCEAHSQLKGKAYFNKNDFTGIEKEIAEKTIFSIQHIINNINSHNWYEDILNYLEYAIASFGSFSFGCGEPLCLSFYFGDMIQFLEGNKGAFDETKRRKLITFFNSFNTPESASRTDLNILLGTYEKWIKIFPFDLSYFSDLNEYYKANIPILESKPVHNPYLDVWKSRLKRKEVLIEDLLQKTNELLKHINGLELYKKGLINETDKIKLELVIGNRKMQLDAGYINNSKDEGQRYRRILKRWFVDEKKFIEEIKPLLNPNPDEKKVTKIERLTKCFKQYGFYDLPLVVALSREPQIKLIETICREKLPYQIAMFDFLGFINHLEINYWPTKYRLHREISKWFASDKEGRGVKGNIASLLKNSKENRTRYTANKYKEQVKKDYDKLK